MKFDFLTRVCHIYKSCFKILKYVNDYDDGDIFDDTGKTDAILWNLSIIGEAASQILKAYPEVVSDFPEIPWSDMRTTRNRIMHGYDTLDIDNVRDTVRDDLPPLLPQLKKIIQSANKATGPA